MKMTEKHVDWNPLCRISANAEPSEATTFVSGGTNEEPDEPSVNAMLRSLHDQKCRKILALLADPKSAAALCEESGLPSSTVYRKLDLLREAALVREYTEVRRAGPNASLYERAFTTVSIGIDDETDEFSVSIERRAAGTDGAEDRMATFWSEMKREL